MVYASARGGVTADSLGVQRVARVSFAPAS